MLRSALARTGANTSSAGGVLSPEAEDGLLIGRDVAVMNLAGTDMAVLSACNTGLGTVQSGDGVFGLRRSFFASGVRTLIMSLWKVPDGPTVELMDLFYRVLLQRKGRLKALRTAQIELRKKHPAYPPSHWGAFICQGDPGPLTWPVAKSAAGVPAA